MEDKIQKLNEIISKSERIVFFGGAGVSTESGIPDFRSVDGLYNQKYKYPPEVILSGDFFYSQTEEFYRTIQTCRNGEKRQAVGNCYSKY